MKLLKNNPRTRTWVAAVAALSALPIAAGINVDQYASPYVYYQTYVDFAASSSVAGHQNFAIFNTSEHYRAQAVKYFEIAVNADRQFDPVGRCYEISTSAPAAGITADTEILVKLPNNPVWQKLSDDYAGTLFSKARFWFGEDFVDPTTVFLRVASFSSSSNSAHFNFNTQVVRSGTAANLPVATEAECFSDAGIAAAFVDRHENVFIRRAI
jgi:hypothetical protein